MSRIRTIRLNILNVAVFAITGLIFFAGSSAVFKIDRSMVDLKTDIEQHWREQARNTLNHTLDVFEKDYMLDLVDLYDNGSIEEWANKNFSGIRNGSSTSDGWIGEIGEGIIISDQSPDCMIFVEDEDIENPVIEKDRYFKNEHIGHVDPEQAKLVFKRISSGAKTTYGDNIWWKFNEDEEWLEFAYYPNINGVDGEYRTVKGAKNDKFKRYVFVLGTQSEEIFSKYTMVFEKQRVIKYLIYFTMFVSFISSVIFMTVIIFKRCPSKGGG